MTDQTVILKKSEDLYKFNIPELYKNFSKKEEKYPISLLDVSIASDRPLTTEDEEILKNLFILSKTTIIMKINNLIIKPDWYFNKLEIHIDKTDSNLAKHKIRYADSITLVFYDYIEEYKMQILTSDAEIYILLYAPVTIKFNRVNVKRLFIDFKYTDTEGKFENFGEKKYIIYELFKKHITGIYPETLDLYFHKKMQYQIYTDLAPIFNNLLHYNIKCWETSYNHFDMIKSKLRSFYFIGESYGFSHYSNGIQLPETIEEITIPISSVSINVLHDFSKFKQLKILRFNLYKPKQMKLPDSLEELTLHMHDKGTFDLKQLENCKNLKTITGFKLKFEGEIEPIESVKFVYASNETDRELIKKIFPNCLFSNSNYKK